MRTRMLSPKPRARFLDLEEPFSDRQVAITMVSEEQGAQARRPVFLPIQSEDYTMRLSIKPPSFFMTVLAI